MSGTDVVRRLNTQAVLDAVLDAGACSGADLMARTGLSRPTVHAVCDDLIG
ncbi:MarR family transcriptional regulator, partial [Pseudonocardia sp. KRD-188]|nr:MarR family transcriptional regulator [Pseudonocardia oceani]